MLKCKCTLLYGGCRYTNMAGVLPTFFNGGGNSSSSFLRNDFVGRGLTLMYITLSEFIALGMFVIALITLVILISDHIRKK